MIRNRIDVETHRAGDVTCEIFSRSVPVHGREIIGAVNHDEIAGAETFGEPVGAQEPT